MKTILAVILYIVSGFASASTIQVPCSTDFATVETVTYNAVDDTRDVTIGLYEESDGPLGYTALLKTIVHTLNGEFDKGTVEIDLKIKINVFRRIRICQLEVFAE